MIIYNNIVYGVADHVKFKRVTTIKKRIKLMLYIDRKKHTLSGSSAVLFQYILQKDNYKLEDILKDMSVINKILFNQTMTKAIQDFINVNWIVEKNIEVNNTWVLSPDTHCNAVDNKHYIINLLYKTIDCISKETFDKLETSDIEKLPYDELFYLYTRKYLQDASSKNERSEFENQTKFKIVYLIFSYDCNLRCVYCFERDKSRKFEMTKEKLSETMTYIEELSKNSNVILVFYGGEPLLEKNRENINTVIDQFKNNHNVYFRFITNGVYVKEYIEIFDHVKHKIINFTITLDGIKSIHDSRRISKELNSSFDAIIESISLLSQKGYPVSIRININHENIDCQEELIGYLNKTIQNKKSVKIEYHRVEDKSNIDYEPISYVECFKLYYRIRKLSKFSVSFNLPIINVLAAIDRNNNNMPQVRESFCTIDSNIVIDYDGQIYSCNEAMGNECFKIGSLGENDSSNQNICSIDSKCQSCNLYLGCYGGCYLSNHYYKKQLGKNKCDYSQIEDVITYFERNRLRD